jgi:hypothetical protein
MPGALGEPRAQTLGSSAFVLPEVPARMRGRGGSSARNVAKTPVAASTSRRNWRGIVSAGARGRPMRRVSWTAATAPQMVRPSGPVASRALRRPPTAAQPRVPSEPVARRCAGHARTLSPDTARRTRPEFPQDRALWPTDTRVRESQQRRWDHRTWPRSSEQGRTASGVVAFAPGGCRSPAGTLRVGILAVG